MTPDPELSGATFTGEKPNFTALPNWLAGKATCYEIHVLWALQYHWPNIHPSLSRLAALTNLSRRKVAAVLSDMERKGWLQRQHRAEGGKQLSTVYGLRIWQGDPAPTPPPNGAGGSAPHALVHDMHHGGSAHGALGVVHEVHGGSARGAHEEEQLKKNKKRKDSSRFTDYVPEIVPESSQAALSGATTAPVQRDPSGTITQPAKPEQPTAVKLPTCAEPHRDLVVAWWRARNRKHPKAPRTLSPQDITALEYADSQGILAEFLQDAADKARRSLGHAYRANIERVMAGSEVSAAFEHFRAAYMAIQDKAHSQSITDARAAFTTAVRKGNNPAQILAALRANVAAYHAAQKRGQFAPTFPDMVRWLEKGRFEAYLPREGASAPLAAPRPAGPVIDGVQCPF